MGITHVDVKEAYRLQAGEGYAYIDVRSIPEYEGSHPCLDHRPPQLDLAQYPHLPAPRVTTTAAADYLTLLGAGAE